MFTLKRHNDGHLSVYFEIYDRDGIFIAYARQDRIYPVTEKGERRYRIDGSPTDRSFVDKNSGKTICRIRLNEHAHPSELDVSVRLYIPDGFLFKADPAETNLRGIRVVGKVYRQAGMSFGSSGEITLGTI